MTEWQPIETAPKVGIFLVFLPNERRNFEVMYRMENTSIVGGAFGFDRTAPTHWMPLSQPPQQAAPEIMMDVWHTIETAPAKEEVWTKIDDEDGERNVRKLTRERNLWWTPDGSMYVYYTPTHWRR